MAPCAGNAIEVVCAIDYLTGKSRPARLHEVTMALCSEGLLASGLAKDLNDARHKLQASLDSGAAVERFSKMVRLLGGPGDLVDRPDAYLEKAPIVIDLLASRSGFVTAFDTRALGLAVLALGGGRLRSDQVIDPAVGFSSIVEMGSRIESGEPLLQIHARTAETAALAADMVKSAIVIEDLQRTLPPLVWQRISAKDCS